jgi:hypothetical protein
LTRDGSGAFLFCCAFCCAELRQALSSFRSIEPPDTISEVQRFTV